MNFQDRAYAVGIFIVLGICCLGAYVAISGFTNANPNGLSLNLNSATLTPTTQSAEIVTETIGLATVPPLITLTPGQPTNTPKGFIPTATSPTRGTPSPAFLSDLSTATPTTFARVASPTTTAARCSSPFCPRIGPPDANLAPTGRACPTDYLWGIVYDKNGVGIPNMEIRYQQINGVSDHVFTKGPPDTRVGGYDIVASSGQWVLQLFASSKAQSAQFTVQVRAPSGNSTTCPTRVDFIEQ